MTEMALTSRNGWLTLQNAQRRVGIADDGADLSALAEQRSAVLRLKTVAVIARDSLATCPSQPNKYTWWSEKKSILSLNKIRFENPVNEARFLHQI